MASETLGERLRPYHAVLASREAVRKDGRSGIDTARGATDAPVAALWPYSVCSSFAAAVTHSLYGVPFAPLTWCLLSPSQAAFGVDALPLASFAIAVTHCENGVPLVPATWRLLSAWQKRP